MYEDPYINDRPPCLYTDDGEIPTGLIAALLTVTLSVACLALAIGIAVAMSGGGA